MKHMMEFGKEVKDILYTLIDHTIGWGALVFSIIAFILGITHDKVWLYLGLCLGTHLIILLVVKWIVYATLYVYIGYYLKNTQCLDGPPLHQEVRKLLS